MALNKNGWGLREMLVLSGILVVFLIIAIYFIVSLYNSFDKEITVNTYYNLEEKLERQADIYINEYFDNKLPSDEVIITANTLKSYGLDVALYDSLGDSCDGYVVANKTHGIVYTKGYIKCNRYTTDGYEGE